MLVRSPLTNLISDRAPFLRRRLGLDDDVDVGALDVLLAGSLQLAAEHRGCWQMLAEPLRVFAGQIGAAARNGENDLRVGHTRA